MEKEVEGEFLVENADSVYVTDAMEKQIELENLVFNCKKNSIPQFKDLIPFFAQKYMKNLLNHAALRRIFEYKFLGDLYQLLNIQEDPNMFNHRFYRYLLIRKGYSRFVKKERLESVKYIASLREYETPVERGSLEDIIMSDDIQKFTDYVTTMDASLSSTKQVVINGWRFSNIDLAAYSGSINILKYLMINNVSPDAHAIQRAIEGGSEDVIEFLETNNCNFNGCMHFAIESHHNKIAKWLNENYVDNSFSITDCIRYFNTEMLIYFIGEVGTDADAVDLLAKSVADVATTYHNTNIVEFLSSDKDSLENPYDQNPHASFPYCLCSDKCLLI